MAIRLDGDDLNKLRDILCRQPQWRNEAGRVALADAAFAGEPKGTALRNQLHFAGSPDENATRFLEVVQNFGHVSKGTEAIWTLLHYLKDRVGLDDEEFIDGLFVKYPRIKSTLVSPQTSPLELPSSATVPKPVVPVPVSDILGFSAPMTIAEYKAQMADIPAGRFMMGSNDYDDEKPVHPVTISGFKMGRTPVTVAMWREYCKSRRKEKPMPEAPSWGWIDDHPIVNVTWEDARAYCEWAEVVLPTEAQWEYAAKGGKEIKYPWGNKFDANKLWCSEEKAGDAKKTAPVYRRDWVFVNSFGLVDMAGNVWEWCWDWYGPYESGDQTDPQGPQGGTTRVLHGGSWYDNDGAVYCRAALRTKYVPALRSVIVGFRVCL